MDSAPLLSLQDTSRRILDIALRRQRAKLKHVTVYSHDELAQRIKSLLFGSGWRVIQPSQLGPRAMSKWPEERHMKGVVGWLKRNGCQDAKDLIAGPCEALAIFGSRIVSELMCTLKPDDKLADTLHDHVVHRLDNMSANKAAEVIFGALSQARWRQGINQWCTFSGGSMETDSIHDYLYGTSKADDNIRHAAEIAMQTGTLSTIPWYLIAYIFDKDELGEWHMRNGKEETAQHSVHAEIKI